MHEERNTQTFIKGSKDVLAVLLRISFRKEHLVYLNKLAFCQFSIRAVSLKCLVPGSYFGSSITSILSQELDVFLFQVYSSSFHQRATHDDDDDNNYTDEVAVAARNLWLVAARNSKVISDKVKVTRQALVYNLDLKDKFVRETD